MKHFYYLDVGSYTPCVQPVKQVPIIPIAMAAAPIGSSIYNTLSGSRTNKKALENQDKLYAQQKAQQDYLNANGALIKRQSMERAGLNPNADYGYSPNLTASTPTPAQLSAPQFNPDMSTVMSMLQLMQQKPVSEAQARQTNADAEAQELQNDITKAEIGANPGGVADIGERNYQISVANFQSMLQKQNADMAEDRLRQMVADGQFENPKVAKALLEMPYRQYRYLINQSKDLLADVAEKKANQGFLESKTATEDLERKITENSNLMELIDKYIPEGGLRDLAHLVVILFSGVSGMKVNLGHNKSIVNKEGNRSSSTHTHTHNTTVNNNSRSYRQGHTVVKK